jgi:hypothetical protein
MKYYKLIKSGGGYDSGIAPFIINKIYSGNFKGINQCTVENYAFDSEYWKEVPAGEYFVQEGIMPEYFAIKRVEDNPLWEKYIDWLSNTYSNNLMGCADQYYGFDDIVSIHPKLKYFKNNPVRLTLEQWDKIINKKEEVMDREIVGWKLKEDCGQYKQAVLSMLEVDEFNPIYDNCDLTVQWSIGIVKKAGVLELWFEPVYKEKTLQFGGYDVTFEKVTSGVRITCNGETGTFSQIEAIYNYFKPNSAYFKFGSQEVKSVTYINGDSWNLDLEHINPIKIKIGCTTGTWKEFTDIYEKAKSML